MLVCPWCGEPYSEADIELLDRASDGSGVWCESCDDFIFLDKEKEQAHRMLLLLENGGAAKECRPACGSPGLRKHLSPLRYPGGKSRVIDNLYSRLQPEHLDTFVEVFAGGASLGLSLLDAGVIQSLVLNDADPLVFRFWRSVLYSPGYLLSRLRLDSAPTHEDYWDAKRVVEAVQAGQMVADDAAAWAFLLVNRLSFSGIQSAHPMGGKHGTQQQLLSRWNPEALIRRIERIHAMSDRIEVRRIDCCTFLEAFAAWYPRATLFVDPPYYVQGPVLYPTAFGPKDHERLADLLNNLYRQFDGPDIILTYDDVPEVRKLYPYAQVERLERAYSIAN